MRLPNFICVGAQKAGTSTLYHLLKQHPNICLPKEKETHFFLNGSDKYDRGLAWYSNHFFNKCSQNSIVGEISPGYIYMPYIPKRILKDIGKDIKLIFMLRNPIDRAYSGYLMTKRIAQEPLNFSEAILEEKNRISHSETYQKMYSYADRGFYAKQIEHYLQFFPIENMFFIIMETDLLANTEKTLYDLCDFLDIPSYDFNTNVKHNPAKEPKNKMLMHFLYSENFMKLRKILKYLLPSKKLRNQVKYMLNHINLKKIKKRVPIDDSTYTRLQNLFYEDIKQLETITGKELSHWIKKRGGMNAKNH